LTGRILGPAERCFICSLARTHVNFLRAPFFRAGGLYQKSLGRERGCNNKYPLFIRGEYNEIIKNIVCPGRRRVVLLVCVARVMAKRPQR